MPSAVPYPAATSTRLGRVEVEAASLEEERKRKVVELQDLATEVSGLKEQNNGTKAKLQSAKQAASTLASALGTEFSLPQDLTAVLASLDSAILAPAMQRLTTVVRRLVCMGCMLSLLQEKAIEHQRWLVRMGYMLVDHHKWPGKVQGSCSPAWLHGLHAVAQQPSW